MSTALLQWLAFALFAAIAIAGALGMATTMSMFRSGVFLMASFVGVAGLFVLLLADLLAWLQVMMYVGGMLVMILFMVLFSHDPGGAMMSEMPGLRGPERFFSLGLRTPLHEGGGSDHGGHAMPQMDMSMTTPLRRFAVVLAALAFVALAALLLLRPAWRQLDAMPAADSAHRVGELLMGKYMAAFEGAGLLILLGIFGSVYLARPSAHPGSTARERLQAAAADAPVDVAEAGDPRELQR